SAAASGRSGARRRNAGSACSCSQGDAAVTLTAVERRSRWPAIVGYYLTGVLAAAQLGKMSALAPLIAADLRLSLTTVALAVSLLELGGATLGVVAGMLASRIGLERGLLGALACLALAAAGSAL